jgi:predicted nucleic acid-binding Zn ribbon protein
VLNPNDVTIRPADKMTADEWRAQCAERQRKDVLYDALEVRLAWLNAHPHAHCKACEQRHPIDQMPNGLCTILEETRKRRVQLTAYDLLLMLTSTQRGSIILRSERLHRIDPRLFQEDVWAKTRPFEKGVWAKMNEVMA